ncbi:DUF4279 domain-containing protein [Streptomyces sp. NBC_00638]|uniref:DUF4279 domain-containing protein n=1 Tax=Streptomyces sp. NBC_00638 TaxID=2975794 RepID=UPI00225AC778|nr:DUF4279 domain-containing protein [Streptomyces sp. NBC_00638]MCX5008846.1 DUF4279 domain-containing protein [Streptomyces sp. NBC_00638]
MPLRQYVYFALTSHRTSAQQITEWLGIEPDETTVRGSRSAESPTVPVAHRWKIVCRDPGLRVDEQVGRVLERLRPHTDRIAEVAARLAAEDEEGSAAVLQVVRCFNDEDTPDADAPDRPDPFGWHLDRDALRFLTVTGAALDVDEYDMSAD